LPNVTGQYGEVCYSFSCNVLSNIDIDKLFIGIPCADLERKFPNDILVQEDGDGDADQVELLRSKVSKEMDWIPCF
jgi:hypothetical protein